jgi:putative membrane protein
MKLRAFAFLAALAAPGLVSATPADTPPTSTPTSNAPTNNSPTNNPTNPTPDKAPPGGATPSDTAPPTKLPSERTPADTTTGNDMNKSAKLSDADAKVVSHLHHVNQMEIALAKDALKQGTAHVKDYASTLVSDHQSADKDLTAFAKAHKLAAIPADKPATDADRQDDKDMTTAMAHLKTLKGAEFDKAYLNMMVSGHDKELTKIDVSISSAGDPDLKSLLQSVKPVLQRHADQARDLQKSPQASADQPAKLPSQR